MNLNVSRVCLAKIRDLLKEYQGRKLEDKGASSQAEVQLEFANKGKRKVRNGSR